LDVDFDAESEYRLGPYTRVTSISTDNFPINVLPKPVNSRRTTQDWHPWQVVSYHVTIAVGVISYSNSEMIV